MKRETYVKRLVTSYKNLSEKENLMAANIVRFHRGKSTKERHKIFNR